MKKFLYTLLDRALTPLFFGLSVACSVWRLFSHRAVLRDADVVVVMWCGGFGHTISCPDAMRRLFKGQRLVCLTVELPSHNPSVTLLWSDVHLVFLPFRWRLHLGSFVYQWQLFSAAVRERLSEWVIWWLKRTTSARVLSILEFYEQVAAIEPIPSVPAAYGCGWEGGWEELVSRVPVPPLRLPDDMRRMIRGRIEQFAAHARVARKTRRFCCLYLRYKGEGSGVNATARRVAGPFETYLPAIQVLLDAGYMVLLTGDRVPDARHLAGLDHQVACAEWVGVDPQLFALFAGTEAELWVGNMGGGSVPPIPNRIPMLVVNGFPYGAGLPHAWMHYKTVRDEQGRLVPYRRLFAEHAFDCDLPGWTLCNNSPEEMANAVRSFLQAREHGSTDASHPNEDGSWLPDHTIDKHVHSRFPLSWLRLFEPGPSATKEGLPLHNAMGAPAD